LISDNFSIVILQRKPIGYPDTIYIGAVGPLTIDFDPCYRRAGFDNVMDDLFDLLGNLRHHFAHCIAQVIFNRDAAYFRQMLIDH
jgi:hypothetical protein